MPSTYTTRNRAEKQNPGENTNSWGSLLNSNTIDMIDQSLDGMASFTVSAPTTLTNNNGSSDQARCRYLNITGGTGGTITIPNVEKVYIVRNTSSGTLTFTTGSGTTATVPTGQQAVVVCEGGNVCRAYTIGATFSTITTTGSATLGDATSDTHTINGQTTVTTSNVTGLRVDRTDGAATHISFFANGVEKSRIGGDATNGFSVQDTGANVRFEVNIGTTPTVRLNQTQVLTTRRTGWTAPTGTPTRTGYATSTATLTQVAEALKALIDDLVTHGVIGT